MNTRRRFHGEPSAALPSLAGAAVDQGQIRRTMAGRALSVLLSVVLFTGMTFALAACKGGSPTESDSFVTSKAQPADESKPIQDDKWVMIKSIRYDADGSIAQTNEYEYDAEGHRIKNTYGNGNWFESEYNANGKRIKELGFLKDGEPAQTTVYEYDSDGNLVRETRSDSDGSVVYAEESSYDSRGNVVLETSTLGEMAYEYDGQGLLVKSTRTGTYMNATWTEYEYDADGREVKSTTYYAVKDKDVYSPYEYGDVTNRTETEYNSDGKKAAWISRDPATKDDAGWEFKIEYEYDKNGNLVRDTQYSDGELREWTEYQWGRLVAGKVVPE